KKCVEGHGKRYLLLAKVGFRLRKAKQAVILWKESVDMILVRELGKNFCPLNTVEYVPIGKK
ncbi:MAG: hypothetical protein AAFV07_12620, partial [Bacteroidota bacterium]